MFQVLLRYLISFCVIFICLWAGLTLQHWLHLSIPGSVIGMIILFMLLSSGVLPVSWVQPGASLFIRYMVFLFIPVSVGLMSHFDTLIENAFSIFLSVVVGSAIVLICMGTVLDRYLKRKEQ
ncbi:CidA/LrgA family protein [Vibrio quintilis]|uniref:Holin-like protein CidA n=1 Tax=Vibrio quintilis TaxID=1117707 RepID=A0A1M7YU40_9VIBR|nr:CidA/LrgA family protein [Vibrio quintilis]SHO56139.1 Holin-like protein CidA [Vibrio quintilis]